MSDSGTDPGCVLGPAGLEGEGALGERSPLANVIMTATTPKKIKFYAKQIKKNEKCFLTVGVAMATSKNSPINSH